VLPGDRLGVYKNVTNSGLVNFNDNKTHKAEIIVMDASKNKSVLRFRLKAAPISHTPAKAVSNADIKVMPYNKINKFSSEDVAVTIPYGALYDTLFFTYKKDPGLSWMYSDIHYIHNKYTPVQKPYTLAIKPNSIPSGKESKLLLIRLSDDRKIAVNSKWSDGFLTADVFAFGKYYIGIDTISPEVTPLGFASGSNLTGKNEIKFRITDQLSGIKTYEGLIDGNWALFEYDLKSDMLTYRFDEKKIKKGIKHQLTMKVSDNKDNISVYNSNFTW
jgi:hypothetical protein